MPGRYAVLVARSALGMLRTVRVAQRRLQTVIAARCGVTSALLCRMELGEREPRLRTTLALCWHLEVEPAGLLEYAESAADPQIRPAWTDPSTILGDADLGPLTVAEVAADMAALARSTTTLLRLVRTARGYDLGDLAVWCGTTSETLARVESGDHDPGLGLVVDLCCYLRVRPSGVLRMAEIHTFGSRADRGTWSGPVELLASIRPDGGKVTSGSRRGGASQSF